jgi:hypothetical protein
MSRSSLILTGLMGLTGAVFLTVFCFFIIIGSFIPILVDQPLFVWLFFAFLLFFSIVEIPVMILGLRRIAASPTRSARQVALMVSIGYVFFAAVYAAPFILLTGWLGLGAILASLSLVRFISAVIYLPESVVK